MLQESSFIATIVVGLVVAFVFGALANPGIEIITRADYDAEVEHLAKLGANRVIMGEREIARAMIEEVRADGTTVNAL
jgi:voltage-gated potassium channel Kch